ncbi:hypothetical protein MUY14_08800 [Amycolatopsis sp. FBCC-B4732]|uniref:hypothetical protein n=1 Tax=Amycolatopsis sp. FBCC-B4732 TaxID=3079339 RepID=UPI001FF5CA85|nr:hypothetical protein [Amycolatopsis sp. FBCC-B4732]UOX90707.1 hypothetical protein MUY14_08800 [Amycolatopsis sp. FBCC-B4732]
MLFGLVVGFVGHVGNGLTLGLLFGLVFGLAAWFAIGEAAWAETPMSDERPRNPVVTFRRDLQSVCVKSLAGGTALGVGFHQLCGRYLFAVSAARTRGRTPLRLMRFLGRPETTTPPPRFPGTSG